MLNFKILQIDIRKIRNHLLNEKQRVQKMNERFLKLVATFETII